MCKLEDIIKTTPQKIQIEEKQNKGISIARIKFNTEIIFALSKALEIPLDKTVSLIKKKGSTCLFNLFRKRNSMSQEEMIKKLCNCIQVQ